MDKKELRAKVRAQKRAMTEEQIVRKSQALAEQFVRSEAYRNAKSIYGYLPYNQEVRTVPMLEQAKKDGKRVAVPKCYDDEMRFIWLDDLTRVEKGYAGIPEPIDDSPVADDPTALVLDKFWIPVGNKVNYTGDAIEDLTECANRLLTNVTTNSFTLSFTVSSPSFVLPEGRCRMYLNNIPARDVEMTASQTTLTEPQIKLVFIADSMDTRFDSYGVLRTIDLLDSD